MSACPATWESITAHHWCGLTEGHEGTHVCAFNGILGDEPCGQMMQHASAESTDSGTA